MKKPPWILEISPLRWYLSPVWGMQIGNRKVWAFLVFSVSRYNYP